MNYLKFYLLAAVFVVTVSCSAPKPNVESPSKKEQKEEDRAKKEPDQPQQKVPSTSGGCDAALWQRVYDPSRLEVKADCKTVTGIVEEVGENEDGDTHLLLKLDPGQEDLLTKRNEKKKDGNLVAEIVCANDIKDKKAKKACEGFTNSIPLPVKGDHVSVTGSYVIDSHNGWAEIHPVSKIERR
jgi:hypothetical protein